MTERDAQTAAMEVPVQPGVAHDLDKIAVLGRAIYAPRFHLILGRSELKIALGDVLPRLDAQGRMLIEPHYELLVAVPWDSVEELKARLAGCLDQAHWREAGAVPAPSAAKEPAPPLDVSGPPAAADLRQIYALGPALYAPKSHLIIGRNELKIAFGDNRLAVDAAGRTFDDPRYDALVALPWESVHALHQQLGSCLEGRRLSALPVTAMRV